MSWGGSRAAPGQGGMPGNIRQDVLAWFQAVDQDRSGKITPDELQRALANGNWNNFNSKACEMMIKMFDKNNKGTVDVNEFQQLYDYINQWKVVFQSYDRDRSGSIELQELTTAFQQMGYRFSPQFMSFLMAKYDPVHKKRISLDNFIMACVEIRCVTDAFRTRDTDMTGVIKIGFEDFLTTAFQIM